MICIGGALHGKDVRDNLASDMRHLLSGNPDSQIEFYIRKNRIRKNGIVTEFWMLDTLTPEQVEVMCLQLIP